MANEEISDRKINDELNNILDKYTQKMENIMKNNNIIETSNIENFAYLDNFVLCNNSGTYYGEVSNDMANGIGKWTDTTNKNNNEIKEISRFDKVFSYIGLKKSDKTPTLIYNGMWNDNLCDGLGQMIYPNNIIYNGDWSKNIKQGIGSIKYDDSNYVQSYIGQWNQNMKNGVGIMTFKNGNIYQGNFKDGTIEGLGKIYYKTYNIKDNLGYTSLIDEKNVEDPIIAPIINYLQSPTKIQLYDGIFKNGVPQEYGVFKNQDFTYTGKIHLGKPFDDDDNGKSVFQYSNGNKYTGNVVNGVPHLTGEMIYNNGNKYTGKWRYGMRFGPGILSSQVKSTQQAAGAGFDVTKSGWWINNEINAPDLLLDSYKPYIVREKIELFSKLIDYIYDKNIRNKEKNKQMLLNNSNGKFTGIKTIKYDINDINTFSNNNLNTELPSNGAYVSIETTDNMTFGKWISSKNENNFYIGYLKNSLPSYIGKIQINSSNYYIGEFLNGMKHGLGKLVTPTYEYNGYFQNDMKNGKGVLTFLDDILPGFSQKAIWKDDLIVTSYWVNPSLITEANKVVEKANIIFIKIKQAEKLLSKDQQNKQSKRFLEIQQEELNKSTMKFPIQFNEKITYWGKYTGQIKDKKANGIGVWKYHNLDTNVYIYGNFINNNLDGLGVLYDVNNKYIYQGEFKNNQYNGEGRLTTFKNENNIIIEEGLWKNNNLNGNGIFIDKNNIQDGTWNNGYRLPLKLNDYITAAINISNYYSDISQAIPFIVGITNGYYRGQVTDGKPDKYGMWISTDKQEFYIGEWSLGIRQGFGAMTYRTSNKYSGYWLNNLANGSGIMNYSNGDIYEGEWLDNEQTGRGTMTYKNGGTYTGYFLANKKHGIGVFENKIAGDYYEGFFINDARFETYKYMIKNAEMLYNWGKNLSSNSTCSTIVFKNNSNESNIDNTLNTNFESNTESNIDSKNISISTVGSICNIQFNNKNGKYYGQITEQKANGLGKWVQDDDNNIMYIGNWSDNLLNGYGIQYNGNTLVYKGSFVNNKRNGVGITFNNQIENINVWLDDKLLEEQINEINSRFNNLKKAPELNTKKLTKTSPNNIIGVYNGETKYNNNNKIDQANGYGVWNDNNYNKYEGQWYEGNKQGLGMLTDKNGVKYIGEFKDDVFTGIGKKIMPNGTIYEGLWENYLMNGPARITSINCVVFSGLMKDDKREGFGRFIDTVGNMYEGIWSNNIINGMGKTININGSIYQGNFINNVPNGNGMYIYPSNYVEMGTFINNEFFGPSPIIYNDYNLGLLCSKQNTVDNLCYDKDNIDDSSKVTNFVNPINLKGMYIGSILNYDDSHAYPEGFGTFTTEDNTVYTGKWFNGQFNIGVITFNNNQKYYGKMLKNTIKNGIAKIINQDTYIIHGKWKNNELIGPNAAINNSIIQARQQHTQKQRTINQGTITYYGQVNHNNEASGFGFAIHIMNNNFYQGQWSKNMMNGLGEMIYNNGDTYKGEWKNNQMYGQGIMIYCSGGYYYGEWSNNQRNGQGIFVMSNGLIESGEWINDEYIGDLDKTKSIKQDVTHDINITDKPVATTINPDENPVVAVNVKKYTGDIPDSLTINIYTGIEGFQKIIYKPSMTIPNTRDSLVYFDPLIDLNTSVINNAAPEIRQKQFFDKGLFNSLILKTTNSLYSQQVNDLVTATQRQYIDNNILLTVQTLFPKNSVIYIANKPYTIYKTTFNKSSWHIDAKPITNESADPYSLIINDYRKKQINEAKKSIDNMPSQIISGDTAQTKELIVDQIKPIETKQVIVPNKKATVTSETQTITLNEPQSSDSTSHITHSEKTEQDELNIQPYKQRLSLIKDRPTTDLIPSNISKIQKFPQCNSTYQNINYILPYLIKNDDLQNYFNNCGFYFIIYVFIHKFINMISKKNKEYTQQKKNYLIRYLYNFKNHKVTINDYYYLFKNNKMNNDSFYESVAQTINLYNYQNPNNMILYQNNNCLFTIENIQWIIWVYYCDKHADRFKQDFNISFDKGPNNKDDILNYIKNENYDVRFTINALNSQLGFIPIIISNSGKNFVNYEKVELNNILNKSQENVETIRQTIRRYKIDNKYISLTGNKICTQNKSDNEINNLLITQNLANKHPCNYYSFIYEDLTNTNNIKYSLIAFQNIESTNENQNIDKDLNNIYTTYKISELITNNDIFDFKFKPPLPFIIMMYGCSQFYNNSQEYKNTCFYDLFNMINDSIGNILSFEYNIYNSGNTNLIDYAFLYFYAKLFNEGNLNIIKNQQTIPIISPHTKTQQLPHKIIKKKSTIKKLSSRTPNNQSKRAHKNSNKQTNTKNDSSINSTFDYETDPELMSISNDKITQISPSNSSINSTTYNSDDYQTESIIRPSIPFPPIENINTTENIIQKDGSIIEDKDTMEGGNVNNITSHNIHTHTERKAYQPVYVPLTHPAYNYYNPYVHNNKRFNIRQNTNSIINNTSNISYDIDVYLNVYPGKDIPITAKPTLICHSKYEQIRQDIAEITKKPYTPKIVVPYKKATEQENKLDKLSK